MTDAELVREIAQAVEPLERTRIWEEGDLPERYPFKVYFRSLVLVMLMLEEKRR